MSEFIEYKPLELDYNVHAAVENLRKAYWNNDTEKIAKAFTDAETIIVTAICNHRYTVMNDWIPLEQRPGTDEEYEEYSKYIDLPRDEFKVYTSPMPDDGEEVLITTYVGDVVTDIYHKEIDACYFEDHPDPDEVIAWMPKPKRYKPEVQDVGNNQ